MDLLIITIHYRSPDTKSWTTSCPPDRKPVGDQTCLFTIELQSQILVQGFYSDESAARGEWPGQPPVDGYARLLIHYRIFHCLSDLFKFYSGATRRRTLGTLSLWNLLFANSQHSIVAPPAGWILRIYLYIISFISECSVCSGERSCKNHASTPLHISCRFLLRPTPLHMMPLCL